MTEIARPGFEARAKFFRNVILYAPARVVPAATGFLLLFIAARLVDSTQVGIYGISLAIIGLVSLLSGAWLDYSVLRFFPGAAAQGKETAYIRTHSTVLSWMLLVLAGTAICVTALLYRLDFSPVLPGLIAASALFGILFTSSQAVTMARGRVARFSALEVGRAIATLALTLAFLFLGKRDSISIIFGYCVANAAFALIAARLAGVQLAVHASSDAGSHFRHCFQYGAPLIGWAVGAQVLSVADRFIIQVLRGTDQAGVYHANYQLLPSLLTVVLAPLLIAAHNRLVGMADSSPPREIEQELTAQTHYFFLIGLPLTGIVLALYAPLCQMLLPSQYEPGYLVVPFVAVGTLMWTSGLYAHKRFEISRRTNRMLQALSLTVVVNLLLTVILVLAWGIIGAAVATMASYLVYPIAVSRWPGGAVEWKLDSRLLWWGVVATMAAILPAATVANLAGLSATARVVFGALTYAAATFVAIASIPALRTETKLLIASLRGVKKFI